MTKVFRFLFLAVFLWSAMVVSQAQKQLPNILFIHTDDLGYHDLSHTGSAIYQTPHIDQLAQSSIRFEQAYSNYPRCTPSRYGMMTGTYPVNEDHGNLVAIPHNQNMIRQFDKAGYQLGYIGKWHLGDSTNTPVKFGFDYSFAAGQTGGTGSHFYPFNTRGNQTGEKSPMPDVEAYAKPGDYLADVLTNATMDYIRQCDREQPFMAILAFYAVHPFGS
ncbi:MAG: sulfatase-like hydrolase/transferase [Saprospiraceae bacterium]